MIVPIEAELAVPPVLTEADEATLSNEGLECRPVPSHVHGKPKEALTRSLSSSARSRTSPDLEAAQDAEKAIIVEFDEGENPRDWPKSKKWLVTISTSLLCLSVAIGSSLPTGE